MFYKYLEDNVNGKDVIYLYLNGNYEIANEFLNKNNDSDNIVKQAKKYMKNTKINFKGKNIYLVVNNIIIGKLSTKLLTNNIEYKEFIKIKDNNKIEFIDEEKHPSIKFVDIKRSNGIIENLKLNEYLFGVIAREMPDLNNIEYIKAEAIIARTYLVKQINENKNIYEENKYQLFWDKHYLREIWKDKYEEYKDRIISALRETNYLIIEHNNKPIECYTHYNDCGKTENAKNILKFAVPYLISIPSFDQCELLRNKKISNDELSKILKMEINKNTHVDIIETTSGYNIRYVKFNDKVYDGAILAKKLGLLSNNYTIEIGDNYTTFITKGCGHGLGLSKCGAINMAKMGFNYKQILSHYYPNTKIKRIS